MGNVPASVGWLDVTAKGILGIADSTDAGDEPDALPLIATVEFLAPTMKDPLIAIAEDPEVIVALGNITCGMDANGVLRPPVDGMRSRELDKDGTLSIVAPDQPASLSTFGWKWRVIFTPSTNQTWAPFTVTFGGKPGDQVNLARVMAVNVAVLGGALSPVIYVVPGPYDPDTDPLPEGIKPGMYVFDESTGDTYLISDDSTVGFFANIAGEQGPKGEKGDTGATGADSTVVGPQGDKGDTGLDGSNVLPTDEAMAQAFTTGGDTEIALDAKIDEAVADELALRTPGAELGYSELLTSATATATDVVSAVDIPGLSITVIGTGRPVDIEGYFPSVTHSVANTNVTVDVHANANYVGNEAQLAAVRSPSTTAGFGPFIYTKRRAVLTDGVSYTFTARVFAYNVAGTSTLYAAGPYQPMFLTVTAR